MFQAVTFFASVNFQFKLQAFPMEVKDNLMRRAILIMHNDLLVSQAVAEAVRLPHKKQSS